jgi:ankyrin repeat protein
MAAARFGHFAVVQQLLAADADASMKTPFGETALSLSLHGRHEAVSELLRETSAGTDWTAGSRRHAFGMFGRKEAQRAFDEAIAGT